MAEEHVNYSIPSLWLNDKWIIIFNLIWLKSMWIILFHLYDWIKCELFYSISLAGKHVNYSIPYLWLENMWIILFHLYGWMTCEFLYSISYDWRTCELFYSISMAGESVNYSIPSLWLKNMWIILFQFYDWKAWEVF